MYNSTEFEALAHEKLCEEIKEGNYDPLEIRNKLEKISNRGVEWTHPTLISAVQGNNQNLVRIMIQELGFNVDSTCYKRTGSYSWCLLTTAVANRSESMVKFLVLEMKANVNIINMKENFFSGTSVLTTAIFCHNANMIKILIKELGADVNINLKRSITSKNIFLPLHYAMLGDLLISKGWEKTKIILELGGDVTYEITWDNNLCPGNSGKSGNALDFARDMKIIKSESIFDYEGLISLLNKHKVLSLLGKPIVNINQEIENIVENVNGPVLILAIQSGNKEMINMIIQDSEANINQEIIWGGKQSTPLIFAMNNFIELNNIESFTILLELGADINQTGWMKIGDAWMYGCSLELAIFFQQYYSAEFLNKLVKLLIHAHEKQWKSAKPDKLTEDLQIRLLWLESQNIATKKKFKIIAQKFEEAKELQNQIEEIKKKEAFMTEEEISDEKLRTKLKIKEPLQIIVTIRQLEENPDYLNQGQIQSLKMEIESLKSSFKEDSNEERHPDLECVICLCIPKPQLGNDNFNVYSCCQHHLLCQNCLERVDSCPICKQNFKVLKPEKNHLAQRMIAQLKATQINKQGPSDNQRGLPNELMKNLQEANSHFQKVKETIQSLEEVLLKARKLQEQKLILLAGSKYLPMEEIEMIIQKSDAKVEDAKLLYKLIEELKKRSGYMTEDEIHSLSKTLQTFKTRFQMCGAMSDGASDTNDQVDKEFGDDEDPHIKALRKKHYIDDEEDVDLKGARPELVTKQS